MTFTDTRLLIALSVLLCLPFVAGFTIIDPLGTTQNPFPRFEVIFQESDVRVHNASILDEIDQKLPVTWLEDNGTHYLYQSATFLGDSQDYVFMVNASDPYGNDASAQASFQVNFSSMWIRLVQPHLGVANHTPFMVGIETEYASLSCRMGKRSPAHNTTNLSRIYDTLVAMQPMGPQPTRFWNASITAFNNRPGQLDMYFFICTFIDPENYNLRQHALGYDPTPPTITIQPSPTMVNDRLRPWSNISITTDDPALCTYREHNTSDVFTFSDSDDPDNFNHYVQSRTRQHSYADFLAHHAQGTFSYEATCTNLAGYTTKKNFTIEVDATTPLTITLVKPETAYVNTASFDLVVQTNLIADSCTSEGSPLATTDFLTFTLPFSKVADDAYVIPITCRAAFAPEPVEASFPLTVDTVAPAKPVITSSERVCSLDELSASFAVEDNGSGLATINYSIFDGSTQQYPVSGWKQTTRDTIRVDDLDLEDGATYTWKVFATDKAGNVGSTASHTVKTLDPASEDCDEESPELDINLVLEEPGTTLFNLSCTDDRSGCKDAFTYSYQDTRSSSCTYNQSAGFSKTFVIHETTWFCYNVSDNKDNSETGKAKITVQDEVSRPSHCANGVLDGDETGVDCGGSCVGCPPNTECEGPEDCASFNCVDNICVAPTCYDAIANGNETGVDCGGSCPPCDDDAECYAHSDCASGYCVAGICRNASCTDGFQNGDETGVDCGGSCGPCGQNAGCSDNTDCEGDYVCLKGVCRIDPSLDSDGDGLPDAWEDEHFGDTTIAEPDEDPDDDGATNEEEYVAGTDPNDPYSKPFTESGSSFFSTILLVLGLLLMLGGALYLVLKKDFDHNDQGQPSSEPIFIQNKLEKKVNPEQPSEQAQRQRLVSRLSKKTATARKKQEMKQLLSHFDSDDEKNQEKVDALPEKELTPHQEALLKKQQEQSEKKKSSSTTKKDSKKKKDDYVELEDLKKQEALRKQDVNKQIFQRLEGITKKTKKTTRSSPSPPSKKTPAKKQKPASATKSPATKSRSNRSNSAIFDDLAKLAQQPKTKVHKVMKSSTRVSAKKMMDIFANVTDKKQINQDVFKAILSELLHKNKLTKSTINQILFQFRDQHLLTEKEVSTIMQDLRLT